MNKLNFAFFGTDEFSVKVLETLKISGLYPLPLIITAPDKPQGRKMIVTPPPVKVWAEANEVKLTQPVSLKNLQFSEVGLQANPKLNFGDSGFDLFIVASYGKIIPQEILDIPTYGTLNIHPSLLPKYRGPSPLETAILNGEVGTGVAIMLVDAKMDHGPILAMKKIELKDRYNFEDLRDKLAILGAKLLVQIIPDYLNKKIVPREQDHEQATYTQKFTKEDGQLGLQDLPLANYRKILALNPWPGTYLDYPGPDGKIRVIVKEAHLEDGQLVYDKVIPAGRREMSWNAFLNGFRK